MSIKRKIAIHRPGALGDVLMTFNLIPLLKNKFVGYDIHYYTGYFEQLQELYEILGISAFQHSLISDPEVRKNYDAVYTPMGYTNTKGYPHVRIEKHILQHFGDDMGMNVGDALPALELKAIEPLVKGPYVTVHPQSGWSLYKNWPYDRWEEVIAAFPNIKFIEIGAATDVKLKGADHSFMGRRIIDSINLISNAAFHLGVDSFSSHITHMKFNGRQTPGVILYGSSQETATGYPKNTNVNLNLPCQPCFREDPKLTWFDLGVCTNPKGQTSYYEPKHACMHNIKTDHIINIVNQMSNKYIA